jgi:hypothetical protein
MKLADIDIQHLIKGLAMERSAWISVAREENRQHTDAERVTMCVLAALEHALQKAVNYHEEANPAPFEWRGKSK